jgi:hypothetical protein
MGVAAKRKFRSKCEIATTATFQAHNWMGVAIYLCGESVTVHQQTRRRNQVLVPSQYSSRRLYNSLSQWTNCAVLSRLTVAVSPQANLFRWMVSSLLVHILFFEERINDCEVTGYQASQNNLFLLSTFISGKYIPWRNRKCISVPRSAIQMKIDVSQSSTN